MAEHGPDKDKSASKKFEIVAELSKPTEITIDGSQMPKGTETIRFDWGNGSKSVVEVKRPTVEQKATSVEKVPSQPAQNDISSSIDVNAFEPGYVFKEKELPEHKKHLAGALCLKINDDGSILTVSAEMAKKGDTLSQFNQKIASINGQINCSVSMGTHDQWSVLLDNKDFVRLANIDDDKAYWANDPKHAVPNTAPVRWSCENSRMVYAQYKGNRYGRYCNLKPNKRSSDWYHSLKEDEVGGRAFSNEEKFDLTDVAPE